MSTKQLSEKFGASGLKGGQAEEWLIEKLEKIYDEVQDYREDMRFQRRGIDFGIKKTGWRNTYTLDCKANLKKGRFFLELSKSDRPGWFWKSQADRIYHVDLDTGEAIWYGLPEMRSAIASSSFPVVCYNDTALMPIALPHSSRVVSDVVKRM